VTVKNESTIHEQHQHQQALFSWNMIYLTTIPQRILKAKILKGEKYPS